jgi:ABC-type amino acid transport substrate-binding protein
MMQWCRALLLSLSLACIAGCSRDAQDQDYRIAYDPSWKGVELMGQENRITGFSRDLLREIGKREKIHLSLVAIEADRLISDLKTEQYDAILSSLYPYLFNQTYFAFSSPYVLTGPVLVLRNDSSAQSIEELSGAEIAVLPDTFGALYLEQNAEILIRNYDSVPNALNDVISGTIDGAVIDIVVAAAYCANIYHGALRIVGHPMNDQGIRLITLNRPPSDLLPIFNASLDKMQQDGTYQRLLTTWSIGQ